MSDLTDVTKYENEIPWTGGILFLHKERHNCFVSICFGDGCNGSVLEDDCDDYIMIDFLQVNKDLELECFDGAMFEFNEEKSAFEGSILKALPAVLDFIEEDIDNLEPVLKL